MQNFNKSLTAFIIKFKCLITNAPEVIIDRYSITNIRQADDTELNADTERKLLGKPRQCSK